MGSMFKWKVSSLGSRGNGNSSGGSGSSKKADKHLNNNAPPPATTQQPPPPTDKNKASDSRDNCPPPQKAIQQPQPQQPVPPPFSPILARSADGFSPRQRPLVQQPHQQQPQQQNLQQQQQQQQLQQTQPKSIGHHYRPVPPAEPQYHQQHHGAADGSQSWNEWNQQLLVRFLDSFRCQWSLLTLVEFIALMSTQRVCVCCQKSCARRFFCAQDHGGCSRFIGLTV
ncbi:Uncharacterized protein APZ42_016206 [Daphnia magna]|uniref:Uncharacterized protein n=1 Tax=Daphnia magna TaxID=35525 RepID=A0A165AJB7_9CRUS|nr:Uncharacterized protein APZ42_016206 [Daphnia magna]